MPRISWKISVTEDRMATDEEVIRAAKLANADTFISQLPDGYLTDIGSAV